MTASIEQPAIEPSNAPERPAPLGWYPWYVAVLLAAAGAVSYLDRQIMSLLTEPIKQDLHLSDVELSLLQGFSFVLFYSLAALPLGYLSDRWPRRGLMTGGILLWSAATAWCGLARSFTGLFAARMSVGIGEASLVPAAQSLLPDFFDAARLGRAFAIFQTGLYVGGGGAFAIGGLILAAANGWGTVTLPIAGSLAPWQMTFLIAALPGPIIALLMLTIKEPQRRQNRLAGQSEDAGFGAFLMSRKLFLSAQLSATATVGVMGHGIIAWTPSFFVRTFGWAPADVGMIYGTILILAGGSGTLIGGALAEHLAQLKLKGAPVLVLLLSSVVTTPLAIVYPMCGDAGLAVALLALFSFFLGMTAAMSPTVLQLATPHPYRGRMGGLFVLATTAVGAAVGPIAIAMVTQYILGDSQMLNEAISIVAGTAGCLTIALVLLSYREFVRIVDGAGDTV